MPRFSKAHLEVIAYTLSLREPSNKGCDAYVEWTDLVLRFTRALKHFNPNFDRSRFTAACRFDYWKDRKPPY